MLPKYPNTQVDAQVEHCGQQGDDQVAVDEGQDVEKEIDQQAE